MQNVNHLIIEQNRTKQNVLCHNNDLDMYIHVSYKHPKQEII